MGVRATGPYQIISFSIPTIVRFFKLALGAFPATLPNFFKIIVKLK